MILHFVSHSELLNLYYLSRFSLDIYLFVIESGKLIRIVFLSDCGDAVNLRGSSDDGDKKVIATNNNI